MNISIFRFAASCQQSTKGFDPDFHVFWEERWSEWMTIGFRFLDIFEDTIKIYLQLFDLLPLFIKNFEEDNPPLTLDL